MVEYWHESSKEKFKTMQSLFEAKRYADCLFFGHLILEKILKAFVVHETKKRAPYTHNLKRLAQLGNLDLGKDVMDLLAEVNTFNLRARYPDFKREFYQRCSFEYTGSYYQKITNLYKDLCQQLRQKKL